MSYCVQTMPMLNFAMKLDYILFSDIVPAEQPSKKGRDMSKPPLVIFASGTAEGGGSGFENLVLKARDGVLDAEIVGVVSNHEHGGVRKRAERLGVPFHHFGPPWNAMRYHDLVWRLGADFIALSGWLKLVEGLHPSRIFNIHPGPLPEFGGKGMYGHHVHEAVMAAFRRGEIIHSAVCMHFVTPEYDRGPRFFRFNVKIREDDTPDSLAKRVNEYEHRWQPEITNLVVHREIGWNGANPNSLTVPRGYHVDRYDD